MCAMLVNTMMQTPAAWFGMQIYRGHYKQANFFSASYLNVQYTGTYGVVKGIPSDVATESSAWVIQKETGAVLSSCRFIQAAFSGPFKILHENQVC